MRCLVDSSTLLITVLAGMLIVTACDAPTSSGAKFDPPTSGPGDAAAGEAKGDKMLPEVSVGLLGPVTSLKGHAWPRTNDWVRKKQNQLADMAIEDRPHELVVHLPSEREVRHFSKGTFFMQDGGTVFTITLMPLDGQVPFQEAVTALQRLLADWGAAPKEEARKRLDEWKNYGNLKPSDFLTSFTGWARIAGEDKAELYFHIRPAKGGWYLSVDVSATPDELRRLRNPGGTQPTTGPR